jgi:hypothetical protein
MEEELAMGWSMDRQGIRTLFDRVTGRLKQFELSGPRRERVSLDTYSDELAARDAEFRQEARYGKWSDPGPPSHGLRCNDFRVLDFSKSRSNDLSTSVPEYGFPDLKPGDRRCLCAAGWQEALKANQAPRVVLRATRESGCSRDVGIWIWHQSRAARRSLKQLVKLRV